MLFRIQPTESQIHSMMDIWSQHIAKTAQSPAQGDLRGPYHRALCAMYDVVDARLAECIAEVPFDAIEHVTLGKQCWTLDHFCLELRLRVPEGREVPGGRPAAWVSPEPAACELCDEPLTLEFYDAHAAGGGAGCLCRDCFLQVGVGVGVGRGQRYLRASDGTFYCVAGGFPPEEQDE